MIDVNHLTGHVLAHFIKAEGEDNVQPVIFLSSACLVSGGNSQYYLGAVHEDEVTNGYTLVNLLLENGDRNIGLEAWTVGDATFQQRWTGYKQAVDEWNEANPDDQATSQSLYMLTHLLKKVQQQLFPFTIPTLIWTL